MLNCDYLLWFAQRKQSSCIKYIGIKNLQYFAHNAIWEDNKTNAYVLFYEFSLILTPTKWAKCEEEYAGIIHDTFD